MGSNPPFVARWRRAYEWEAFGRSARILWVDGPVADARRSICNPPRVAIKFYSFDVSDTKLDLVPLAARRALDNAGLKLSLEGWRSLTPDRRRQIAEAGTEHPVKVDLVARLLEDASPAAVALEPMDDCSAWEVPAVVRERFSADELPVAVWSALTPLDRYVMRKVAMRGKSERIRAAYDEIVGESATSTHLRPAGGVRMVSVEAKHASLRSAIAESTVKLSAQVFERLKARDVPKGDVLSAARIAGIMASKRTSDLIPLCHTVSLTSVDVHAELLEDASAVKLRAEVRALDRTGVEMEALLAVSVASLTVYDMLKGLDRTMTIGPTQLIEKKGGRSGDFRREEK